MLVDLRALLVARLVWILELFLDTVFENVGYELVTCGVRLLVKSVVGDAATLSTDVAT